jgi:predicted phage terminase large subunit-like protein
MVIFASFSKRLGLRANLRLQRIFDSPTYRRIFPETYLANKNLKKGRFLRNSDILELVGQGGSFRNTTVNGSVTGESLDIGVVDDPLKGRDASNSLTIRDKTWDWLTDDFLTRFSDLAALLFILTRWNVDDPVGRLIIAYPNVRVLKYPAIAESGIPKAPGDNRKDGEALFPEHKSAEFLIKQKSILPSTSWMSLYQQMPIVLGGNIIKGSWFKYYITLPKIVWRIITADTAQKTKEHNDFSVFQCWGMGEDGKIYLLDQVRGKWEAPDLRRTATAFWAKHKAAKDMGALRKMLVEDKSSGTGLIQDLKHGDKGVGAIPIKGIERNVDKFTRVQDVLSYIETGYVYLPQNEPWISDFVSECEAFTADDNHPHDDQIDPMCDAIVNMLQTKAKGFFDV